MKIKREATLGTALEEISSVVEGLRSEGAARLNGHEIKLDEPVTLEIEMESKKDKAEIEFEIKWPREATESKGTEERPKKGKRGKWLLGIVTGAALGAAAFALIRRHSRGEEEFSLD